MAVMLVASVGGHLRELVSLVERFAADAEPRTWVTWRNPQSESLLAGETVEWVPPVHPRQVGAVLAVSVRMHRLLELHRPDRVVTTGSAIALTVGPAAARRGIPVHFIDSVTRTTGPSVTGRLLQRLHGVRLYTQHASWAAPPWRYGGSVFDGYAVSARPGRPAIRRVVVTFGTMEGFPFTRLRDRLAAVLPAEAEVLWQTGCTPAGGLGPRARPLVPARELAEAMAGADVVVGHCGAGTALAALDAGSVPVLVPRLAAHGEHVDDHQVELAVELRRLGLAVTPRVEELALGHLLMAAAVRADRVPGPPFPLAVPWPPLDAPAGAGAARRPAQLEPGAAPAAGPGPADVLDLTDSSLDLTDTAVPPSQATAPAG